MRIGRKLGYPVIERNISPHKFFIADEVFFTGTAVKIVPIRKMDKRIIGDGKLGPVTKHDDERIPKSR